MTADIDEIFRLVSEAVNTYTITCSECGSLTDVPGPARFVEAVALIHAAMLHPALFYVVTGKDVEAAVAEYAAELGERYERAKAQALRKDWT